KHPPLVRVAAVGLVRHLPAGVLLLAGIHRPGRPARRNAVQCRRAVRAGSAGDREPGHLVAVPPGDSGLPHLVGDPPGLAGREWGAGAALLGIFAGWATWLPFVSRTKFYYYALEFEPFIIICIVLCLGLILGPATARRSRGVTGAALTGAYVLVVLVLFGY